MTYNQSFGKNFKEEIRRSKPYLILGTVMYLITISVAYGILTTFEGATFSLNREIIFTVIRDYLILSIMVLLFLFLKTLFKSFRRKNRKS